MKRHWPRWKVEQPGKLLRVSQEMTRESPQIFVGEKLNKFGDPQAGRSAIERVHQANADRAGRMGQRKIDSGWTASVMADWDDLLKPQGVYDRF